MAKRLFGMVGAGGFGREVMPVVREMFTAGGEAEQWELVFVVEGLSESSRVNGYEMISDDEFLARNAEKKSFNIAIADSAVRERVAAKLLAAGIAPQTIRAANSSCYDDNIVGVGAIFCAFTTVTSNARIGRFFHANIYSYVAHDCVIGDFVTFAPNVHCNGRVIIEDHAYIGTGAVLKQGSEARPIVIGRGAVVGMGAVVTKSVPALATVVGNPAAELARRS